VRAVSVGSDSGSEVSNSIYAVVRGGGDSGSGGAHEVGRESVCMVHI